MREAPVPPTNNSLSPSSSSSSSSSASSASPSASSSSALRHPPSNPFTPSTPFIHPPSSSSSSSNPAATMPTSFLPRPPDGGLQTPLPLPDPSRQPFFAHQLPLATPLSFPSHSHASSTVPATPGASIPPTGQVVQGSYFPSTPQKPLFPSVAQASTPSGAFPPHAGASGTTPTLSRLAEMTLRSPLSVPVPSGAASAGGMGNGSPPVLSLPGVGGVGGVAGRRTKAVSSGSGSATGVEKLFPASVLVPYFQQKKDNQAQAQAQAGKKGKVLVLDLRPPSAFIASHLPDSLSLPIPSTLLRRPAFPLASVCQMLPERHRPAFEAWKEAELVVVLERERDGLGDGGRGLLAKFEKEVAALPGGKGPKVGGIRGGWEAVRRLLPDVLVSGEDSVSSPAQAIATAAMLASSGLGGSNTAPSTLSSRRLGAGSQPSMGLRDLPLAAFQQITTTAASSRPLQTPLHMPMPPLTLSHPHSHTSHHAQPHPAQQQQQQPQPPTPFPRPHSTSTTHSISTTINTDQPAALPPSSTSFLATNPFYDNIRQHLELAQGVSGAGFEPLVLPKRVREWEGWGEEWVPRWLREVVERSERQQPEPVRSHPDGGEALAMQFYKIELAEQRRLMGVMEHHTRESGLIASGGDGGSVGSGAAGVAGVAGAAGTAGAGAGAGAGASGVAGAGAGAGVSGGAGAGAVGAGAGGGAGVGNGKGARQGQGQGQGGKYGEGEKEEFPFSITAGIEKGTLNRYRNIWPFAHTRVRLPQGTASDGSDYVNASFVHPRGTRRRYVCAQGPLEATRGDFWNLVWDQNITTIIMLTKQTEAGLAKCFPYWREPIAGPFRLRHISTSGGEDEPSSASGGFFDLRDNSSQEERGPIRRVFALSREGVPGERIVTQLQMVSWPDWEVPRSPRTLLDLIKRTNALRAASPRPNAPVLVHCSAGVGRTGSFVLIDAVLDALRSELLAAKARMDRGERPRGSPDRTHAHASNGTSTSASGTGTTAPGSPSFSSLSLSLHNNRNGARARQSSVDSSAPTSRSPSTDVSSPPSPSPGTPMSLDMNSKVSPKKRALSLGYQHRLQQSGRATPEHKHSYSSSHSQKYHLPSAEANPQSQNSFDFQMPHSALHRDNPSRTPTPLSDMEPDPIQHVLEDMREQRMSLCQSLTQYVFCHRAICEGAIELAEEIFGPTGYSLSPDQAPVSPNAMDVDSTHFAFDLAPATIATPLAVPEPTKPFALHHPHAKRAASKSPEEVERVLSLTPGGEMPSPGFPGFTGFSSSRGTPSGSVTGLDGLSRKPSLKRQMTRRGDVGSGSSSPAPGLR